MSSNTHRVGTVLAERYQLRESLGAGGLGQVFRAWDVQGQRAVAVKVFNPARSGPDALDRYNKLIAAAGRLGHPGVLLPRGLGLASKNPPLVVMDALTGEDLGKLRARLGRLPWPRALELAGQTAEILHALHGATRVPHRDLKPGNVFITDRGEVRVLDYGIAEFDIQSADSTRVDTALGVVDYKAPEQLEGATTDERTDVFSLGVLLYEMVTGALPFQGPSYYEVARRILFQPAPRLGEVAPDAAVPLGVEALILRSLAKKPGDRFADLQAMARAIGEVKLNPGVAPAAGPAATPSGTVIDPKNASRTVPGAEDDDPTTMLVPPRPRTGVGAAVRLNMPQEVGTPPPPPQDRTVVSATQPRVSGPVSRLAPPEPPVQTGRTVIAPPQPTTPRTLPGPHQPQRTVVAPTTGAGNRTVIGPTTGADAPPPEDRTVVAGRTVVAPDRDAVFAAGGRPSGDQTMVLPDPSLQRGRPGEPPLTDDDVVTLADMRRVAPRGESTMILSDDGGGPARGDTTMVLPDPSAGARPNESTMLLPDGVRGESTMALPDAADVVNGRAPEQGRAAAGAPKQEWSLQKTLILVNVVCGVLILVGLLVMLLSD